MTELQAKHQRLRELLVAMRRVVVAFSGGVDSTLVLKVAMEVLGEGNVLAATGVSPSLAQRELRSVKELASLLKAPLELVGTAEMDDPQYAANPANRCYFCKSELYTRLGELARSRGYDCVVNGVNLDDTGDWRPGIQAARDFQVRSPLIEAGLGKSEVRELARELKLPNWEKPALACLSSRVPYGMPVTIASLSQIEQAEAFLYAQGLTNLRVRHHQALARIELPVADLPRLLQEPLRSRVIARFKELGYTYITLDIQGFRSGSGNEVLKP